VLKGGCTNKEAETVLKNTNSAEKNELLFSKFGINYSKEEAVYRKGSVLYQKRVDRPVDQLDEGKHQDGKRGRERRNLVVEHIDIIGDAFWKSEGLLS